VAPLLGVAADTLTDQFVPLREIWGACDELCDDLIAADSVAEVLDVLSDALEARTRHETASAHLARRAVRMFETEIRVDSVAKQLGVTSRHLRRAFVESVGVAPKEFVRGVRLQRAIQRTTTDHDWGRIANDVGYYDQSHLIADFRDLVGLTPGAYLARRRNQ
jgi:AraC-like DNA-binding protein